MIDPVDAAIAVAAVAAVAAWFVFYLLPDAMSSRAAATAGKMPHERLKGDAMSSEAKEPTSRTDPKVTKRLRKSRRFLALLAVLIGAGAGYEVGWGWGVVIMGALLSVYFLLSFLTAVAMTSWALVNKAATGKSPRWYEIARDLNGSTVLSIEQTQGERPRGKKAATDGQEGRCY